MGTQLTTAPQGKSDLLLWYKMPAMHWNEALPIGNGRFGGMVFGGIDVEQIQLNDITVWSGKPTKIGDRKEAYKHLPLLRRLIQEGKYAEAEKLSTEQFTCNPEAPYKEGSYQILGYVNFTQILPAGMIKDYKRYLDLSDATVGVSFKTSDNTTYSREIFASYPDKAIIIHLTADNENVISFDISLSRPERAKVRAINSTTLQMCGNTSGEMIDYETQLKVIADNVEVDGNMLKVRNSNSATIIVCSGTSYVLDAASNYKGDNPHESVSLRLKEASSKAYSALLSAHIADYKKYFERQKISLGLDKYKKLPTPERIKKFATHNDPHLAVIYYQFARYLTISASRPDNPLPMNLVGIWSDALYGPWNNDYHANINLQMNYWPTQTSNLAEFDLPLMKLISSLVESGKATAKEYFNANGWCLNVSTNVWGWTAPGKTPSWGMFWTGGSWLCQHIWEHYAFTQDLDFLKKYYPVMKESAVFIKEILVENENGFLTISPSASPENYFSYGKNKSASVCDGATMDISISKELFQNTAMAAEALGIDSEFAKELTTLSQKLRPLQIGKRGRLMEWSKDWEDADPQHRHISHLYALYPGREIVPYSDEKFAAAAKRTLLERGADSVGWSQAWKINFYARLRDSENAYALLKKQLNYVDPTVDYVGFSAGDGGSYPNLFDSCPPFCIDGNFGSAAGISEMLLQSFEMYMPANSNKPAYILDFLPALPNEWREGKIFGLVARGGIEVDFEWENHKLKFVTLHNKANIKECKVRYNNKTLTINLDSQKTKTIDTSEFN